MLEPDHYGKLLRTERQVGTGCHPLGSHTPKPGPSEFREGHSPSCARPSEWTKMSKQPSEGNPEKELENGKLVIISGIFKFKGIIILLVGCIIHLLSVLLTNKNVMRLVKNKN